jgi:hypothetical protein
LPLNLPFTLILQVNHHMRSSIFSSMSGRYAFTVSVRGLRPKNPLQSVRHAVRSWARNATQTVLDEVLHPVPRNHAADRTRCRTQLCGRGAEAWPRLILGRAQEP